MIHAALLLALGQFIGPNGGLDDMPQGSVVAVPTSVFRAFTAGGTPGTYASPTADTGQAGTFTRASTKSCFTGAGNSLVSAASGALCVESGSSAMGIAGYLAEPASTNVALQSLDLGNAAWTNLALTVVSNVGVFVSGATTMASLTGTAATAHNGQSGTVTSSVGPFTHSAWLSSLSGTVLASVSGGGVGTIATCACATLPAVSCAASTVNGGANCQGEITATTSNVRVAVTLTNTSSSTQDVINTWPGAFGASNGLAFYGAGAQLEALAYATSYIPTTGTAATRAADVLSFSTTSVELGTVGSGSLTFVPEWNFNADSSLHMLLQDVNGGLQVAYNAASQKFQAQTNSTIATSLVQSFLPYTSHTVYWRYTNGGNTCVQVDAAAEVCTAGTTSFTPGATFIVGGTPTVGAGGWVSNVKLCTSAFAPGGCT